MANVKANVFVGDNPTTYSLSLLDGDVPYDPSTADTITFLFECPDGTVYEREATVTGGSPTWTVEYQTTVEDADTLHGTPGKMKLQVWLQWDDGRQFHSSIERTDDDGDELRVHKNLAVGSP